MTLVLLAGCGASYSTSEFTPLPSQTVTGSVEQTASAAPPAKSTGAGAKPSAVTADPVKLPKAGQALAAAGTPGSNAYKIGPQDILDISVFKVPELARTVQVTPSGTVSLPLIGEVVAAGKITQELEREVAAKLGEKYLQAPVVTVLVKEFNSQRVTVEGAVKKPGVYPLKGATTLLQIMATVEMDRDTSSSEVLVFRQISGKRYAAKFDISGIRGGTAQDPIMEAGDVVIVETSAVKSTFNTVIKALPLVGAFSLLL